MIVTCTRDQARTHMYVEIPIDCYDFRMHLIGLFYQLHTSHMIPNELGVHIAFFSSVSRDSQIPEIMPKIGESSIDL